jgi:hypothetical protein
MPVARLATSVTSAMICSFSSLFIPPSHLAVGLPHLERSPGQSACAGCRAIGAMVVIALSA